jgi:hypothetical protein
LFRCVRARPRPTTSYAKSDKSWVSDPAGVRWETFYTFGESAQYGEDEDELAVRAQAGARACCGASALEPEAASTCC